MAVRPAVEAEGLVRTFGDVMAVDGIDLSVSSGEVFGFLGLKACMIQEREIKRKGVYSEPMDKLSLEALSGFFEPYNQVLYELIRQDLAWETEVHALPAQ